MSELQCDIFISGAGVAGATAGLLAAQAGLSVIIVDKRKTASDYKELCTHFVQPAAAPILKALGIDCDLAQIDGVRTKAAFRTMTGWIDPGDDYSPAEGGDALWAYNLERSRLDPYLRRRLAQAPDLRLAMNTTVITAEPQQGAGWTIKLSEGGTTETVVHARALVAADGRLSPLAQRLGNDLILQGDNDRSCVFGYYAGVLPPSQNRSLFLLDDASMSFLYPLAGRRALLSAYIERQTFLAWPASEQDSRLRAMFDVDERVPDVSGARLEGRLYGYRHYPNFVRRPGYRGAFFIGDAVASLDPMSGVGCSFAMVAASMAIETIVEALKEGASDIGVAAAAYSARFEHAILPHAKGIMADSLIGRTPEATNAVYRQVTADVQLQRKFIALTGRLITPSEFQRAFLSSIAKSRHAPSIQDASHA